MGTSPMWFGLAAHSGARVTHSFPTLDILVVVGFSAYYKNEVVALAMYVITHTCCHPHTPPSHPILTPHLHCSSAGMGEAKSGFLQFQTSNGISVRVPELEARVTAHYPNTANTKV